MNQAYLAAEVRSYYKKQLLARKWDKVLIISVSLPAIIFEDKKGERNPTKISNIFTIECVEK